MSGLLIVLTVVLILVVVIQISKASEYVSILKGKEKSQAQANKVNATLLILFLIFGLIGVYLCNEALKGKLLPEAASVQGEVIDKMIWVTLIITGIVFFLTQILLFYFAYHYRARPGHKATFFPQHSPKNDRLEIIWTSVTLLVLMVLIVWGLKEWFKITGPAPKDSMVMEVVGKQFNWMFRYPGKDGELGKVNYKLIDPAKSNPLGQDWSDKANDDDVVSNGVMHLVVDKPVRLIINSQDVIHDVGMPYFRLKMDAVPGMPTTLWFTPTITTKQMIKKTGDPNFVYELACDQLCGNGHYSMRATIIVETQQEFDKWVAGQKSQYQLAMASEAPAASDSTGAKGAMPAAADSTAKGVAVR
jgi:cytochrome c oxidase subunit 2